MAKNNPLFVDSTKFHGDRIGTQIELHHVMVYDDETLVVKIVDHHGESHRVVMEPHQDGNYMARVWLHHQKAITYQFMIERDGQMFLQSAPQKTRAQYAIIAQWQPWDPSQPLPEPVAEEAVAQPLPDTPWTGDFATTVESLIQKWGL